MTSIDVPSKFMLVHGINYFLMGKNASDKVVAIYIPYKHDSRSPSVILI